MTKESTSTNKNGDQHQGSLGLFADFDAENAQAEQIVEAPKPRAKRSSSRRSQKKAAVSKTNALLAGFMDMDADLQAESPVETAKEKKETQSGAQEPLVQSDASAASAEMSQQQGVQQEQKETVETNKKDTKQSSTLQRFSSPELRNKLKIEIANAKRQKRAQEEYERRCQEQQEMERRRESDARLMRQIAALNASLGQPTDEELLHPSRPLFVTAPSGIKMTAAAAALTDPKDIEQRNSTEAVMLRQKATLDYVTSRAKNDTSTLPPPELAKLAKQVFEVFFHCTPGDCEDFLVPPFCPSTEEPSIAGQRRFNPRIHPMLAAPTLDDFLQAMDSHPDYCNEDDAREQLMRYSQMHFSHTASEFETLSYYVRRPSFLGEAMYKHCLAQLQESENTVEQTYARILENVMLHPSPEVVRYAAENKKMNNDMARSFAQGDTVRHDDIESLYFRGQARKY